MDKNSQLRPGLPFGNEVTKLGKTSVGSKESITPSFYKKLRVPKITGLSKKPNFEQGHNQDLFRARIEHTDSGKQVSLSKHSQSTLLTYPKF